MGNVTSARVSISNLAGAAFLCSFFFVEISTTDRIIPIPSLFPELIVIITLMLYTTTCGISSRRLYYFGFGVSFLLFIQLIYFLYLYAFPLSGNLVEYVTRAMRLYLYLVLITFYSIFLYKEKSLIQGFYYVGLSVLIVGIAAWVAYQITGLRLLLDFAYGFPRVKAFFSEPSATAPVVAAIAILGWKKRSWPAITGSASFLFLSASPTVFIVVLLSITGVFILERRHSINVIVGGLLFVLLVSVFIFGGGPSWIIQNEIGGLTIRRLMEGVNYAITLSDYGYNPRFAGAMDIFTELQMKGLLWTGAGLNSASVYFGAVTPKGQVPVRDFSLFLTILFSYGLIGTIFLFVLAVRTAFLLKSIKSTYLYIYIPFLITSMINSAQGFLTYKFVLLGIIAYLGDTVIGRRKSSVGDLKSTILTTGEIKFGSNI